MSLGEQVLEVDAATVAAVEAAMAVQPVEVPEHHVVASLVTRETARQALQQSMDRRW